MKEAKWLMPEEHAWLFDVYPHPTQSKLVVWTKHGEQVEKRLVDYQPHFCIKAEAEPLDVAERILADDKRVARFWRDRTALWLRGPEHEVLRIQPKRLQQMHAVAQDLRRATKSKGYLFFDVDNQPESRWMHENGLWTMCRLAVDGGQIVWPLCAHSSDERFTIDYPTPDLRTFWLSVEVDKQGHTASFDDPLVSLTLGNTTWSVTGNTRSERASSERGILLALKEELCEQDPDVIFTKHGDRFDIPYVLHRIRQHGLQETIWLGRDRDPDPERPDQEGKSISTYGRWLYKTAAYYLRGRWHIDLSKKTLDSEDDRKDIHGILYLARVSNRRAQDVNRNGAGYALQQMQIDKAVDMGTAIPWKRNLAEDWKDAATLCAVDRGGQIMVPTPGIYEDVAACDFSGYYPSLVVRHNLSSDTINCHCCPDGPVVPELNYHVCEKHIGHQSGILGRIASHRKWAKAVLRKAKTTNPTEAASSPGSDHLGSASTP